MKALVDTGATFSVLPSRVAERIGLKAAGGFSVELADGTVRKMPVATGVFRVDGRRAPATVLVAPAGEPLLGVETLEVLGLSVDPKRRRVKALRPFAIKAA
jgi:clan AA aspartic protease